MFLAKRAGNCPFIIPDAWRPKYLAEGWEVGIAPAGLVEPSLPIPLDQAQASRPEEVADVPSHAPVPPPASGTVEPEPPRSRKRGAR